MKTLRLTMFLALLALANAFILNSCKNDNEEELYGTSNDSVVCDTSNVTYTTTMKSFFDSKCKSCHYDGNVYPFLDQSSTAHNYAITPGNLLYEKITSGHEGIAVTACEKEQMKKWINSGAN